MGDVIKFKKKSFSKSLSPFNYDSIVITNSESKVIAVISETEVLATSGIKVYVCEEEPEFTEIKGKIFFIK